MTVYTPTGVCSREIRVELDGDKIASVEVIGGCNGNLKGISRLLKGMDARDAIERMRGTTCGMKSTSCPDQISYAIEQALAEAGK